MESITALNVSTPAQYGRACTTCARAKAKCTYQEGTTKCERCFRLEKACQPSPSFRSPRTKKRVGTKTARLEEKLDGLVNLLTAASKPHSGQDPTPGQLDATAALSQFGASPESLESRTASPGNETTGIPGGVKNQVSDEQCVASSHAHNVYFPNIKDYAGDNYNCKSSITAPPYQLSPFFVDEADESLVLFRTQMLRYFPFMILPESTTPDDLRISSPFLWLCIMAMTTKSTERRKILGVEIRQTIATKLIMEGQKSKDYINGLLLYAAWGQYFIFAVPIMTHVLHLAIGSLGDLGLKRPPPKESPCIMLNYDARGYPKPILPESRTIEDRRLAISCWSASQFVSFYFQKVDTMRWSPYYDECLRLLTESQYPSDTFLVQLVQLQLIHEKVNHAPWHDMSNPNLQPCSDGFEAVKTTAGVPASLYVRTFLIEMNKARKKIPDELRQNDILTLYGLNLEVSINEAALSKNLDLAAFDRLEFLWAALQAVKRWFDLFLCVSPANYVGVSMNVFAQFAHCLVALSRLSSFEHPHWDVKLARETCSFSTILDQVIDRFANVKAAANLDGGIRDDVDIFSSNARRITAIKTWWNAKLATEQANSTEPVATAAADPGDDTAVTDPMLTGPPIDFSDDSWLRDIMSLDDYQFNQYLQ